MMTVYRTHPEYRALLAAVCTSPGDDLPRLVLADWLEENGEHERAEFIRVQCELAMWTDPLKCPRCGDGYDYSCEMDGHAEGGGFKPTAELGCASDHFWKYGDISELRRRERELWGVVQEGMRPECNRLFGNRWFVGIDAISETTSVDIGPEAVVRRGFVAEVRCTLADWCGACRTCGGRGVFCSAVPCNGTGIDLRQPGVGPRLVREHPVERVVCSDRQPWEDGTNDVWSWFHVSSPTPGDVHPQSDLPAAVYGLLGGESGRRRDDPGVTWKDFPTREAADAALSAALIRWAKSQGVVDE